MWAPTFLGRFTSFVQSSLDLAFISFSVSQVIPYCLYNIHVCRQWTSVHHSVFYQMVFSSTHFATLAVCLWSLLCWKIKPFPIGHFPEGTVWWSKTCLYFSAFVIQPIRTISPLPLAKTRTGPPPLKATGTHSSIALIVLTYHRYTIAKPTNVMVA